MVKPHTLPIYGDLNEYLKLALEERSARYPKCKWVVRDNGQQVRCLKGEWKTATERAGLPGLLSHSAVRNSIRAGIAKPVAKKISRAPDGRTFERYNIVSGRDNAEAREKLAPILTGTSAAPNKTDSSSRDGASNWAQIGSWRVLRISVSCWCG